jgi:trimeric autotransporter adhesin
MKFKFYQLAAGALLSFGLVASSCSSNSSTETADKPTVAKEDGYDSPSERYLLEIEKTKDPALGYVPVQRLLEAMRYTEEVKASPIARTAALNWTERGPSFDSVGPSNGNGRGAGAGVNLPGTITSGRIRAVLIDQSDPTGNTVFTGGIMGGLWKTTNFLSASPNWVNVNDYFANMGISWITQNPANPDIMYFSTGEPTSNADAVLGAGIWKSTDHGNTWAQLPSTTTFTRTFRLLCDNAGNVYAALRAGGLRRSSDGGNTWFQIAPSGFTTSSVTDIEMSSTGVLHASFGYFTGTSSVATYRRTTSPATVSTSAGWETPTGLPTVANRIEIATLGDFVYLTPTNTSNNVYGAYLSTDGGQNFRQKHVSTYTTSLSNTQGWYNISLDINPANPAEFIVGGLDAYRSVDSGASVTRLTRWVSSPPYVHADHHYVDWHQNGAESRILMATDGGLFLSQNNGVTFSDRNRNLNLKQFYSIAIHPTLPNYFLAGSQDNGVHQLKYEGLGPSVEVTGGDGAYVHINQLDGNIQYGSYVFGVYRRSTNGGATWNTASPYPDNGLFINPFDVDDATNTMYACYGSNIFMRWPNAHTATSSANTLITVSGLGTPTAFKVSPYTANRLFIGSSSGRVFKISNAGTVTNADVLSNTEDISPPTSAYINCVNVGSSENNLVAVATNYGVQNIWVSTNGGLQWTAQDGNLPDMPVRWAIFHPTNNDKMIIATETGVWITHDLNGAATQWVPSPGFPTVRTDMLRYRASDNLIAAGTHGRGVFTANILAVLPVRDINLQATLGNDGRSVLSWTAVDPTPAVRFHIEYSNDGRIFNEVGNVGNGVSQYRHSLPSKVGYYRIKAQEPNQAPVYSNTVVVKSSGNKPLLVQVLPNPVEASGSFIVSGAQTGNYTWEITDLSGRTVDKGQASLPAGGSKNHVMNVSRLTPGRYTIRVIQNTEKTTTSFLKK